MRVLFIRHAIAEDKKKPGDSDLQRPLTEEGRQKARIVFKALGRVYPPLDHIYASEAVRARQTAEILSQCFADARITETALLNPGSHFQNFRKLLGEVPAGCDCIAVVGHDPDLSRMVAEATGSASLRVDMKKASCIEVDVNTIGKGELKAFLPPRILIELAGG